MSKKQARTRSQEPLITPSSVLITDDQIALISDEPQLISGVIEELLPKLDIALDAAAQARLQLLKDMADFVYHEEIRYMISIVIPVPGDNYLPIADRIVVASAWTLYDATPTNPLDPSDISMPWGDAATVAALSAACGTCLTLLDVRLTIRDFRNRY